MRTADLKTVSLQEPICDGEADTIQNLIPNDQSPSPDQELVAADMSRHMHRALPKLKDREQKILHYRFGLDGRGVRTLEEISQEFGLTRERIRQIQKRALEKLRSLMSDDDWQGQRLAALAN